MTIAALKPSLSGPPVAVMASGTLPGWREGGGHDKGALLDLLFGPGTSPIATESTLSASSGCPPAEASSGAPGGGSAGVLDVYFTVPKR